MVAGKLSLNSKGYSIVPFEMNGSTKEVHRYLVDPIGESFRISGGQRQEDLKSRSTVVHGPLTGGFGRADIPAQRSDDPAEYRRFWDSTADTRALKTRLGLLGQAVTGELTAGDGYKAAGFVKKGSVNAVLWQQTNRSGSTDEVAIMSISGTALSNKTQIDVEDSAADGVRAFDLQQDGANYLALLNFYNGTDGRYYLYRNSADPGSGSWTQGAAIGSADILSDATRQSTTFPLDGGLIAPQALRGERVVAVWDEANSQIELHSTTDSGAAITAEITIPSDNGPQGIAVYPDTDDVTKLWIASFEGIWAIDTTAATWVADLKIPLSGHADNGRRMTVQNGKLWFHVGGTANTPAKIWTLETQGATRIVDIAAGLDGGDGVPPAMLGNVEWMFDAGIELLISVGGSGSGRDAHFLSHNGEGWHHLFEETDDADAEMVFSDGEDIWAVHAASADQSEFSYLEKGMVNPESGIAIPRLASSFIDHPFVDGGMPFDRAVWQRVAVDAANLSATNSNEFINVDFVVDDGTRGGTDLGDFLSGTKVIKFGSGTAGEGESGINIALRVNYARDGSTNTDTPAVKAIEIAYTKHVPALQGWWFLIDLEDTANIEKDTEEAIITRLEDVMRFGESAASAAAGNVEMQYGNSGAKYVQMKKIMWGEDVIGGNDEEVEVSPDTTAQRRGFVLINLEEPI